MEPTVLGLTRDDAIWAGYGMRVYDLSSAWSPVWRVGPDFAELPASLLQTCESSVDGQLDLRLLGEPGDAITAGPGDAELSGAPQITNLAVRDCQKLAFSAHADVAPFAQLRPTYPVPTTRRSRKLPASVLTVAPTAMSPLSICGTETPTAFHHIGDGISALQGRACRGGSGRNRPARVDLVVVRSSDPGRGYADGPNRVRSLSG